MKLDAYLLTRQWRDTPQGIELSFWASTDRGALNVVIEHQRAVCFIERNIAMALPANVERIPRELQLLHHGPVDALYFNQQKQLQQLRQQDIPLCESDIKPADRYLMERFIRASFSVEGDIQTRNDHLYVRNPRLSACEYQPRLKTVAIDIETRGHSRQLYSIAAATLKEDDQLARTDKGQADPSRPAERNTQRDGVQANDSENTPGTPQVASDIADQADMNDMTGLPDNVVFMIGQGAALERDDYTLVFCASEKELMLAFLNWVQAQDPDVLSGWAVVNFDLNFLDQKCRALGIPFKLGRGGETAAVLQPGNPGSPRVARVPGRAVLDGIDQLKAGFWSFDSFSLDNVSHELLGNGKLITPEQDKVATINRLFVEDKPQLANYNIRDCTLVNEIFIKADLLAFAIQRANLTGLALDRLGGSVAAFDNLYLPLLHRKGFVAPDVATHSDAGTSPGGYVLESRPGLFRNVLVLDFKSLYPSIIKTFFIDPLGLAVSDDNPVPGFVDATFSREEHILPELIDSLWRARDEAKLNKNAPLSQAIKIIMNSFYGILGSGGCRFYSQQLASSITRRGHEIIQQSRDWIEQQGFDVIYGDTDSVFVWLGEDSVEHQSSEIGRRLMQGLNDWWQSELQQRYNIQSHLEVEYETHYLRFFMPTVRGLATGSKKRYAGLSSDGVNTQPPQLSEATLVIKGLEAARTDWTPLARRFQRELFLRIFKNEPFEDFVRQTVHQLNAGELDEELVYRKRIRRNLQEYLKNVPPHIKAARKLEHPGNTIRYLITRNGPEPEEALESAIDYQHYLDKQLAPAADGILQFMDTSVSNITDAQLQMF